VTWRDTAAALPVWEAPSRTGRAAVVVAHPDDETLALAGPLDHLARNGWRLDLLVLTDGEAAYPDADDDARARLALVRRGELVAAWHLLVGAAGSPPTFAGLPDSGLTGRPDDVRAAVEPAVKDADLALGLWPDDPHPDHGAAGAAVVAAAAGVPTFVAPLWSLAWWPADDPRHPWGSACRVRLDAAAASRRQRALASHASQVRGFEGHGPLIGPAETEALLGPDGVLVRA